MPISLGALLAAARLGLFVCGNGVFASATDKVLPPKSGAKVVYDPGPAKGLRSGPVLAYVAGVVLALALCMLGSMTLTASRDS